MITWIDSAFETGWQSNWFSSDVQFANWTTLRHSLAKRRLFLRIAEHIIGRIGHVCKLVQAQINWIKTILYRGERGQVNPIATLLNTRTSFDLSVTFVNLLFEWVQTKKTINNRKKWVCKSKRLSLRRWWPNSTSTTHDMVCKTRQTNRTNVKIQV